MSLAKEVATAIVKSGLWGEVNPNTALMLCFLAEAEGHHPAVVYRDYHILQGKPSKKAEAILRDFSAAGGRVEWHTLDDTTADATFHHPSGTVRIEWTIERAVKANLKSPMWSKYPRQMLRSRCISEGVRSVCPAATSGLYEQNEVADILAEEYAAPKLDLVVDAPSPESEPTQPSKRVNWGGRYPNKTSLHKALIEHQAELRRIGDEGVFDDLDGYLTSPEYTDFLAICLEQSVHYLEGGEPAPAEFIGCYDLEQRARDMIAVRGNNPIEKETT